MKKGVYYSNLENEFYVVTNIPEINSNRLIFMFMVYDNGTSTWIWLNKPTKEFLKESCVYVGEF